MMQRSKLPNMALNRSAVTMRFCFFQLSGPRPVSSTLYSLNLNVLTNMSNLEHYEIFKQGVDFWNQWRQKNPDIKPDLSEIDISYCRNFVDDLAGIYDLDEINLSNVNLEGSSLQSTSFRNANFTTAKLSGSNLVDCNFSGAQLHRADLRGSYLDGAQMIYSRLFGADLSDSYLTDPSGEEIELLRVLQSDNGEEYKCQERVKLIGANLTNANLTRANLEEASLQGASLVRTNFNSANLTGVQFYGTSRDDWNTDKIKCEYFYYGKMRTPILERMTAQKFDDLLSNLSRKKYTDGSDTTDYVFISYVTEDYSDVQQIVSHLKNASINIWIDKERLKPGDRWNTKIESAIRKSKYFLPCFSKNYLQKHKSFMNTEMVIAINESRQRHPDSVWFIPLLLSDCDLPIIDIGLDKTLSNTQHVALWKDWTHGINQLIETIVYENT